MEEILSDVIDKSVNDSSQPETKEPKATEPEKQEDLDLETPKQQEGEQEKIKEKDNEPAHHAFAKLRVEKKKLAEKATEQEEKLSKIAEMFNTKDIDELLNHLESEAIRIKAVEEKVDPEILKKELEAQELLKQTLKEKERLENELKEQKTIKIIDDFSVKYGLTSNEDYNAMLDALVDAGLDLEILSSAKKPEVLLKGATADLLLEKTKSKKATELEKVRKQREKPYEPQSIDIDNSAETLSNELFELLKGKL